MNVVNVESKTRTISFITFVDLPVYVATEHLIGFLDVVGLSATCRRGYPVLSVCMPQV